MNRLHFHLPRIIGRIKPRKPIDDHDRFTLAQYERAEGVLDTLIVIAVVIFIGVLIWGFMTSTGDTRWFDL